MTISGTRREVPPDTRIQAQTYYPQQEFVAVGSMEYLAMAAGPAVVPWYRYGVYEDGRRSRTAFNPYEWARGQRR